MGGQQFVRVYFKTFFNDPKSLLSLYKEESTFTRGEGKDVVTYKGLKEIETALEGLQANCLVDVRNVVIQDSLENYIVTVTGLFRDTVADSRRAFTQVFLLHPQKPKGLFVLNEVFLYADHEEDDADERDVLDVSPVSGEKESEVPAKGETRYVEVNNFDPPANKDVLKKAFASFGVVKYVSFQGQQRAILEFETPEAASSVLSAKSVKVDDKLVRVAPSSAPPPRNNSSRGKARDAAGARGGRGGRTAKGGSTRGATKSDGRPFRNSGTNSQQ